MKVSGIYSIVNSVNMQFYVGRSTNVHRRLKQHLWDLRANRHTNPKLQNSFNKYGESVFTFELQCELPEENLVEFEQLVIDEGIASGRCFNINNNAEYGGVTGRVWTKEQINNIKNGQQNSPLFAKTSLANQTKEQREQALLKSRTKESREKAKKTRESKTYIATEVQLAKRKAIRDEAIARALQAIEYVMLTREPMRIANKIFKINQRMWAIAIPIWEEQTGKIFDLPKKATGSRNGNVKYHKDTPIEMKTKKVFKEMICPICNKVGKGGAMSLHIKQHIKEQ